MNPWTSWASQQEGLRVRTMNVKMTDGESVTQVNPGKKQRPKCDTVSNREGAQVRLPEGTRRGQWHPCMLNAVRWIQCL